MRAAPRMLCPAAAGILLVMAAAVLPCRATDIWFGPRGPEIGGSPDWDQLFKPTPAWSDVAARLNVYSMTAGYVLQTPDQELRAMAADLASHHVTLSLSAQSVSVVSADACGQTEGYSPLAQSAATADKLARLGIRLDSVVLDSALWFGHYATGPQECGFSVQQVAERVAMTLRPYLHHFPALTIGDVEGLPALVRQPGWQADYEAFLAAVAAQAGRPISFLQTDDNWQTPDIDQTIVAFARFAHAHGLRIGVIYDGDGLDTTDAAWVASAIRHFTRLESAGGLVPDQAFFASWNQHPTRVLPETDPATFSHAVEVYQRARVHLTATRAGAGVQGRLLDEHAQPVAAAQVSVQVVGSLATQQPPPRVATGVVPAAARSAIIGLRVNMECVCAGPNDLLVGDFTYAETGAGHVTQTYSLPQEALKRRGKPWDGVRVWPVSTEQGVAARVVVSPEQRFGFNSGVFAVTPGADFSFLAPVGAVSGGGMFGTATIIWLDAAGQGLQRTNITLVRDASDIAQGVTDVAGRFAIGLPDPADLGSRMLTVTAAATRSTRGTILELQ